MLKCRLYGGKGQFCDMEDSRGCSRKNVGAAEFLPIGGLRGMNVGCGMDETG